MSTLSGVDEKAIIAVVTGCFILPFILFSPLAGILADKYSKRSIAVFWKVAEVVMMGVGLFGLLLPHLPTPAGLTVESTAIVSAGLVVAVVFLMGTHSAFWVPAKYGVMPEILHPDILSRGNGILESTSFVSQILGTCFGAALYMALKKELGPGEPYQPHLEWRIGAILLGVSVVGAICSLVMRTVPPAAPERAISLNWWATLRANLGLVRTSRTLLLATLGIGFFAFMTLFMRQSLIYEGEIKKEMAIAARMETEEAGAVGQVKQSQKAELRIAVLIAQVALGVGVGSWLAGYLSGRKLELGLIAIGGVMMVLLLAAMAAALFVQSFPLTVVSLIGIGTAAGIYIVPLYTLLQHRAPKSSKGNLVATSNVVNMLGGMLALAAFYGLTWLLEAAWHVQIRPQDFRQQQDLLRDPYLKQLEEQIQLPSLLFLIAAVLTLVLLVYLDRLVPDLFLRAGLWWRGLRRQQILVDGLHHLPTAGPALLATDAKTLAEALSILSAADRRVVSLAAPSPDGVVPSWLVHLARRSGWIELPGGVQPLLAATTAIDESLRRRETVAVPLADAPTDSRAEVVFAQLRRDHPTVPVIAVARIVAPLTATEPRLTVRVRFGEPMPLDATIADVRRAIHDQQKAAADR